jgi:hypothetical protein
LTTFSVVENQDIVEKKIGIRPTLKNCFYPGSFSYSQLEKQYQNFLKADNAVFFHSLHAHIMQRFVLSKVLIKNSYGVITLYEYVEKESQTGNYLGTIVDACLHFEQHGQEFGKPKTKVKLELSEEVIRTLLTVSDRIGGCPRNSCRKYIDEFRKYANDLGYRGYDNDIFDNKCSENDIYLKDFNQ